MAIFMTRRFQSRAVWWRRVLRLFIADHMQFESLFAAVLIALTAIVATTTTTGVRGERALPIPICNAAGFGGYRFTPKAPAAYVSHTKPLVCSHYKSATCCNITHSIAITRTLSPFFDDTVPSRRLAITATASAAATTAASGGGSAAPANSLTGSGGVSDECRTTAASLLCSTCDPLIGIGYFRGVCPSACDKFYSACADEWWTVNDNALPGGSGSGAGSDGGGGLLLSLVPCVWTSLVCFALREVISDGRALCDLAHLRTAPPTGGVGLSPNAGLPPNSPVVNIRTRALIHYLTLSPALAPTKTILSAVDAATPDMIERWSGAASAADRHASVKPTERECFDGDLTPSYQSLYRPDDSTGSGGGGGMFSGLLDGLNEWLRSLVRGNQSAARWIAKRVRSLMAGIAIALIAFAGALWYWSNNKNRGVRVLRNEAGTNELTSPPHRHSTASLCLVRGCVSYDAWCGMYVLYRCKTVATR